jgi:hypothetical protein
MDAFLRAISFLLLGIFIGAAGMLFFTPSFNVVVSRHPGALKLIELAATPKTAAVPDEVKPVAVASPAVVPAKPIVVADAKPSAPIAPAVPAADPAIDFKSISEHLILWPTAVSVKTATTVPVIVDGKKVQDLALDVGTVLQVSKVLADGSIEVRAKGAKFEIKSTLTDFSTELGKRVSELVAKGAKFDSPFATGPVAMTPVAPADAPPAPIVPAVSAVLSKGPLTLAQRVDVLFSNKPAAVIPAATAPAATPAPAAVVPVAPIIEVTPAPTVDPKAGEKGKDLDRKINQLFK